MTVIDHLVRLHPGKEWRNVHTLYRWCLMAYEVLPEPESIVDDQDMEFFHYRTPLLQAIDPALRDISPSPEECLAGVDAHVTDYLRDKLPAAKMQALYSAIYGQYHNRDKTQGFSTIHTPPLIAFLLRDQDM
jgi:hypothetical protein